ncbi:DUF6089 family protein [Penaeicola halotolerans]|uniref:type IX secretion system protein PorG n=1 Tax=Penaeicola halotolerans TaxID=2793196 RepID=UPI001CF88E88|nr:DUF6089 family protein [Penaeicola halotolerans]
MGYKLITLFLLIISGLGQRLAAQQTEVGFGLGAAAYSGDMHRFYDPRKSSIAATLLGRYNFNNTWSVRGQAVFGRFGADDADDPLDPQAAARGNSFSANFLEGSVVFEYHFLDYREWKARKPYSPYLFGGLGGAFIIGSYEASATPPSFFNPVIPFGVGIKFKLNTAWQLAVEVGPRKTFSDLLDGISESTAPNNKLAFDFGNVYDKDWYYFTGITLSYSFYKSACPVEKLTW